MRRPLDWFVVSLSLMVWLANRLWVTELPMAALPPPAGLRGDLVALTETVPSSPFAYVRQDGSQVYLPITGVTMEEYPLLTPEDLHAASGFAGPLDSSAAVYTWSSPISASTSSR